MGRTRPSEDQRAAWGPRADPLSGLREEAALEKGSLSTMSLSNSIETCSTILYHLDFHLNLPYLMITK